MLRVRITALEQLCRVKAWHSFIVPRCRAHQFVTQRCACVCVWTLARRANSLSRCLVKVLLAAAVYRSPHYLLFIIIIVIWSEGVSTKPTSDKIFRFSLHTAPLRFAYNIARRTQHKHRRTHSHSPSCWCGARKKETKQIQFHWLPWWFVICHHSESDRLSKSINSIVFISISLDIVCNTRWCKWMNEQWRPQSLPAAAAAPTCFDFDRQHAAVNVNCIIFCISFALAAYT